MKSIIPMPTSIQCYRDICLTSATICAAWACCFVSTPGGYRRCYSPAREAVQARSELRFWRGAEVNNVKNPTQLYVVSLGKVRKIVNFWQFCWCTAGKNCDFLVNFWHLKPKFKGLLGERRRRERKFWNRSARSRPGHCYTIT